MQNKVVLAITGASGSIYAKQLIEKLLVLKSQWEQLSVVMTENAKTVWGGLLRRLVVNKLFI